MIPHELFLIWKKKVERRLALWWETYLDGRFLPLMLTTSSNNEIFIIFSVLFHIFLLLVRVGMCVWFTLRATFLLSLSRAHNPFSLRHFTFQSCTNLFVLFWLIYNICTSTWNIKHSSSALFTVQSRTHGSMMSRLTAAKTVEFDPRVQFSKTKSVICISGGVQLVSVPWMWFQVQLASRRHDKSSRMRFKG